MEATASRKRPAEVHVLLGKQQNIRAQRFNQCAMDTPEADVVRFVVGYANICNHTN